MLSFMNGVALRAHTQGFKTLNLPNYFPWNPSFTIYENGKTNYTSAADKPTGTEKWVDVAVGSDTNDGSQGSPYKTLAKAYNEGTDIVQIKAGIYDRVDGFANGFNPTRNFAMIAADGPGTVIINTQDPNLSSWVQEASPNDSVYKVTRSGVIHVLDYTHPHTNQYLKDGVTGTPNPYTEVASIASCQSTPGSWYQSGSDLYVHTHDSRAPDSDVQPLVSDWLIRCSSDIILYAEGIEFWGDHSFRHSQTTDNTAKTIVVDCGFRYNTNTQGLNIDDIAEVRVIRCDATDNINGDGFSYHIDSAHNTTPQVLEVGCYAARNGNSALNTANGSSAHDGALIIRAGGTYENNYGPNIVDVLGAQSMNIKVTARNSLGTSDGDSNFQTGQFNGTESAIMYLKNCVSAGSTYDRYRSSGGTIIDLGGFGGDASDFGIILGHPDADLAGQKDLLYWFDPADTSTITEIAGAVSDITEKSASKITLTQTTSSAKPTTDSANINGHNVLDLDGGDHMKLGVTDFEGVSLFADTARAWTAFLVCEADGNGYFLAKAGSNGANRQFGLLYSSGNLLSLLRGSTTNVKTGWDGSKALVVMRWDGTNYHYFFNDQAKITGVAGSAAEETSEEFLLGARTTASPGFQLDGRTGPQLIYGRSLSDEEVAEVQSALNTAYAIY